MKLKAFFADLARVFKKHFRPVVEKESGAVLLLRNIQHLQAAQKNLNEMRDGLLPIVQLLKDDPVKLELDRLVALAAPQEPETVARPGYDGFDEMFG